MAVDLPKAVRNPISLTGVAIATAGAIVFLVLLALDLSGQITNPYAGLLVFIAVPALFVLGLLLIPFGLWQDRRKRARGESTEFEWPHFDFNKARHRQVAFWISIATFVNVLIVSLAAYSGIHYMDSNEFCGQVCHSVMSPEYTAFQDSAHSRVGCVQCHIGSGAPWFVKAKISGIRQVFAVTFNAHPSNRWTAARNSSSVLHAAAISRALLAAAVTTAPAIGADDSGNGRNGRGA